MRFFLWSLIIASVTLLASSRAAAAATRSIELHADVVDFYSNRYILTADGHVRAQLTDGTIVRGTTFSMDLKLNRFLIAGDVHVDGPKVHETGAAFAGYPDLERSYFISEGDTPDRWTYFGEDFSDPHKGRTQPGDAFHFPDLTGDKPYIISGAATIFFKNNVEFPVGSRIDILGAYVPTPGYVVNYSSNPNFYQNAFFGAIFDVGVPFHGAADAMSALHFRYDQYNGFYTAFDQHFVHNLDYAVFSVDPLTQNQRQWIAILYKRVSPAVEVRTFFQLFTQSIFLNEPKYASFFSNAVVNAKVGRYAVGLNVDQSNPTILGGAEDLVAANGVLQVSHPFDATLTVQSFEDEIRAFRYVHVPVKFQYRAGYGYNYNSYGMAVLGPGAAAVPPALPTWGGAVYPAITNTFVGLTLYTASIPLAKQLSLSAKADRLETWYSLPHHVVTTDVSETIARTPLSTKLPAFLVTYDVLNIGDFYGSQQLVAYPPAPDTETIPGYGTYTGLAAFDGFATSRSWSGSIVYTPTPYFALNLTMQHFITTPKAESGLGGAPPWVFNPDVRVRINQHILVDIARQYFFNFSNELWAPQYTIQFSP